MPDLIIRRYWPPAGAQRVLRLGGSFLELVMVGEVRSDDYGRLRSDDRPEVRPRLEIICHRVAAFSSAEDARSCAAEPEQVLRAGNWTLVSRNPDISQW
jgi:hypothetical protein